MADPKRLPPMHFTKMHGIGNDYVVIQDPTAGDDDRSELARSIADRHHGIGCDGLIVLTRPRPGVAADVRMRMLNPDGSEAQMCGNGIRCACKHAYDSRLSRARPMRVETAIGVLVLEYEIGPLDKVTTVTVDMGEPSLAAACIPVLAGDTQRVVDHPLEPLLGEPCPPALQKVVDGPVSVTCVSMGNPHAVIFCNTVESVPLDRIGPWLERHPIFPERVNVHVARVDGPKTLTMRSWERGAGLTLACGTGACAVCVAAALTGRAGRSITTRLPGGTLEIHFDPATGRVLMTGPAEEVFTGDWPAGP